MLAQNFKSPAELQLNTHEHATLIKFLGMLEREELHHINRQDMKRSKDCGFNMSDFSNECGTVFCIAGWCDRLFGTTFVNRCGQRTGLDDLFLMSDSFGGLQSLSSKIDIMDNATPAQAAIAVRNFLTTGEPRWLEVLESN